MIRVILCLVTFLIGAFCSFYEAFSLCVDNESSVLREGPGEKFQETWEIYRYMPIKAVNKKGAWLKIIDVDGDLHWVKEAGITSEFHCATVKVSRVHLRTGPGTRFALNQMMPKAEKYTTFKLLTVKQGWAKVQHELGASAWISRELLWVQ